MKTDVYKEISISTEVMTATPHRQIQMLMEKCLQKIELAKSAIETKDLVKKHKAISHGLDIIIYLRSCLNKSNKDAKNLSELLESLYGFMEKSLIQANIKNDVQYLQQAGGVLANIKAGWDGIA